MQLFHKYRLIPASDEDTLRILQSKEKLVKILDSNIDPTLKMAQFRDLLSKLRNFQIDIKQPPTVRLDSIPETKTIIKQTKVREKPRKRAKIVKRAVVKTESEPEAEPETEDFFSPAPKSPVKQEEEDEEFSEITPDSPPHKETPKASRLSSYLPNPMGYFMSSASDQPPPPPPHPQKQASPKRSKSGRQVKQPQRYGFGRKRKNLPMGESSGKRIGSGAAVSAANDLPIGFKVDKKLQKAADTFRVRLWRI